MKLLQKSADSTENPFKSNSHSCAHCKVPLHVFTPLSGITSHIAFPQTIKQARDACLEGCPTFIHLLDSYRDRSIWRLLKTHVLGNCECCHGVAQRFKHLMRSLSRRPFTLVLSAYRDNWRPEPTLLSFAYLDAGDVVGGTRFNAYTYTDDNASSILPSIDMEVHNTRAVQSVRQWLSSCACIYNSTGNPPFIPTRIIDLEDETTLGHIVIRKTENIPLPAYVCLSYCWGGPQPHMCSRSKLDALGHWTTSAKDLPAAIQDAMRVTRDLGFRYLWIDSLCIVQDDSHDREREILQMHHIYKNAALTICASTAQSSRESFLQPRPDTSEQQVQLIMSDGRQGTVYLDSHNWFQPPITEPLGSRAWAFQEQLLSSRLVEYGWRTVRWTCSCQDGYNGNQHITLPVGNPQSQNRRFEYSMYPYLNPFAIRRFPRSRDDLLQSWALMVNKYSSLKLTDKNDRLAAISGVARVLHDITGVPYLAGLWDYERLPSLLQRRVTTSPNSLHLRPETTRAPSWSWAGLDDPVSIQPSEEVVSQFKILASSVSCEFGSQTKGSITLQSLVRSGTWWSRNLGSTLETDEFGNFNVSSPKDGLVIWPDCANEFLVIAEDCVRPVPIELAFLAVGRSKWDLNRVRGLILKRNQASNGYVRVGLFYGLYDAIQDWETDTFFIT